MDITEVRGAVGGGAVVARRPPLRAQLDKFRQQLILRRTGAEFLQGGLYQFLRVAQFQCELNPETI